jgi:hypothetical protein
MSALVPLAAKTRVSVLCCFYNYQLMWYAGAVVPGAQAQTTGTSIKASAEDDSEHDLLIDQQAKLLNSQLV